MPVPSPLYIICNHGCYSCFVLHQLDSVEFACLLSICRRGRGERSGSHRAIEFRAATSSKSLGSFLAYSGKTFDIDFIYRELMSVALLLCK